jgi:putative membrane protein
MESWIEILPSINASLNGLATIFLTLGFFFIKSGKKEAHRNMMVSAFSLSVLFLVFYVTHKVLRGMAGGEINTTFQGEGFWKTVYYLMLISHVLLAMVIVPLILRTLYLALRGRESDHKTWARWTFPLWYYVSITGVLVYFFLYHWFV